MTNLKKTGLEEKLNTARDKHKNLRIKTKPKNLGTKIPGMRAHLGGVHERLDAVEKKLRNLPTNGGKHDMLTLDGELDVLLGKLAKLEAELLHAEPCPHLPPCEPPGPPRL
jgi:hypothetical protein